MALLPLVTKDGNNASQSIIAWQDASGFSQASVSLDTSRSTYRASGTFTPQATGAVTMISLQGSATKTVRLKRFMIGGTSTANAQIVVGIQRTSALGAGGTTVAPSIAKMDTNFATATAVVQHYTTSLKAAGTAVGGVITQFNLYTSVVTTPTLVPSLYMAFPEAGVPVGSALVLRGTADFFEFQNLNAGNLSAATILTYVMEWEEDAS